MVTGSVHRTFRIIYRSVGVKGLTETPLTVRVTLNHKGHVVLVPQEDHPPIDTQRDSGYFWGHMIAQTVKAGERVWP
jgi:hypothetical protein